MTQRAIVYARVSTTRQADHDLSIPDQLEHAKRYSADRNIEIIAEYVDAGASARDDNRPQFQRMVGDVKTGAVKADILLFHRFSRFFRESYGSAFYSRLFAKHGFWNGSRPPFGYRTYVAERAGMKKEEAGNRSAPSRSCETDIHALCAWRW